ncbi:hypothetical protein GCM10010280_15610 [Streptomyces pilosus]|uniref:Transposase IS200-like domain-containing protein n=1 Tax=Streptomyces pilosus TaxID=28893 RepID=A0A918EW13_9ACTN|nr:hypothetical protein GCM10010280_15610 [Streptomyces pilosus]
MLTRCEEIMRKVCKDFEAELKEFNGGRDHVHLLINYPPKAAVSKLVNSLKGVSARRIRLGAPPGRRLGGEFTGRINPATTHGHLWSPSYFSASCGGRRWRSSVSTSSSNNVCFKAHVKALMRCVHPWRERRGFLQGTR